MTIFRLLSYIFIIALIIRCSAPSPLSLDIVMNREVDKNILASFSRYGGEADHKKSNFHCNIYKNGQVDFFIRNHDRTEKRVFFIEREKTEIIIDKMKAIDFYNISSDDITDNEQHYLISFNHEGKYHKIRHKNGVTIWRLLLDLEEIVGIKPITRLGQI